MFVGCWNYHDLTIIKKQLVAKKLSCIDQMVCDVRNAECKTLRCR